MFIVLEGTCEGSGKSTQAKMLYDSLIEDGYDCILTKEPGSPNSFICKNIRKILLDNNCINMNKYTELYLFLADRFQHIQDVIVPNLKEGRIVISDRFELSGYAIQCARGIAPLYLKILSSPMYKIGLKEKPHTFLLDVRPEIGLTRITESILHGERDSRNRIDAEVMEFHKKIYNNYIRYGRGKNITKLNGMEDKYTIHQKIKNKVTKWL